jgi:predicted small lipoprotein YifL
MSLMVRHLLLCAVENYNFQGVQTPGENMKRTFSRGLIVLFFLSSLAACGVVVTNMYTGPQRPDTEVATLKSDRTRISKIDGKDTPFTGAGNNNVYKLLPGRHSISISLFDNTVSPLRASKEPMTVSIYAEPSATYITRPVYTAMNTWYPEVVEEGTNIKVGR